MPCNNPVIHFYMICEVEITRTSILRIIISHINICSIRNKVRGIRNIVSRLGLYQKCFFFFKKCFWHCSLSSQKMLKISRDSLKNAFSHFLSRLYIRSNKHMIEDQDTGMGRGMLSYFRKGEEDSAILHK